MAYREIPETAVEIQTGLYLNLVQGTYITMAHLYSSEGYCFYDKTAPVYDEEGNQLAEEEIQPNQRLYAQYRTTSITDIDVLNAKFVSVPVDPSYEIVSAGGNHEVA